MSDNIAITAGAGTTVATDQLADGSHVQLFKLLDGTADGTGRIPGDSILGLKVDLSRYPVAGITVQSIQNPVPVTDNSGSLTVDGSISILAGTTISVVGSKSHDDVDSGQPIKVGGRSVNGMISAVSTGDRTDFIADLYGRQLVSHIDPGMQIWKQVEGTTQATGSFIWQPASGKKIAVTSLIIGTGATTGGVMTIWFGASNDGTFNQGTDQTIFRSEFAPSSTSKPGAVITPAFPFFAATADHVLRITTSAAITFYVQAYGYEF